MITLILLLSDEKIMRFFWCQRLYLSSELGHPLHWGVDQCRIDGAIHAERGGPPPPLFGYWWCQTDAISVQGAFGEPINRSKEKVQNFHFFIK